MDAIPAWVAPYVGLPYAEGGRTRAGLDCFGLVRLVCAEIFGQVLTDYDGPPWKKGADAHAIAAAIREHMTHYPLIPAGAERAGDGVLLRMRGVPLHVGLVVAPGWMLHVYEGANACVERYRSLAWEKRVLGFYRAEGAHG